VEFPEPVREHSPCQGIFRLAFVEPDMNAPPQFGKVEWTLFLLQYVSSPRIERMKTSGIAQAG
jgi:hypothetical protein